MPRIPAISGREELAPEHRAVWDAIQGSRGQVRGPFAMLLHSPELAGRVAHLGAYVRFEGVLDPRTKEVVVLATARELRAGQVHRVRHASTLVLFRLAHIEHQRVTPVD